MSADLTRRIVCAANRRPADGLVVCSARHYDPRMRALMRAAGGLDSWQSSKQGFINTHGEFLTREAALEVALANGQRIRRCGGDELRLFSENLY